MYFLHLGGKYNTPTDAVGENKRPESRVGEIFTALTLRRCWVWSCAVTGPARPLPRKVHMPRERGATRCLRASAVTVHFLAAPSRSRDISAWAGMFNDQFQLASPWKREVSYDYHRFVIRLSYDCHRTVIDLSYDYYRFVIGLS